MFSAEIYVYLMYKTLWMLLRHVQIQLLNGYMNQYVTETTAHQICAALKSYTF